MNQSGVIVGRINGDLLLSQEIRALIAICSERAKVASDDAARATRSAYEAGLAFLELKAGLSHGQFVSAVLQTGVHMRTAQRWMAIARSKSGRGNGSMAQFDFDVLYRKAADARSTLDADVATLIERAGGGDRSAAAAIVRAANVIRKALQSKTKDAPPKEADHNDELSYEFEPEFSDPSLSQEEDEADELDCIAATQGVAVTSDVQDETESD